MFRFERLAADVAFVPRVGTRFEKYRLRMTEYI